MSHLWQFMVACLFLLTCASTIGAELTAKEVFGKRLFFDRNLSLKGNQACSSCHLPDAGWSGDNSAINAHGAAYEGSVAGRFGNRKPPSAAYATPSPVLHFVREDGATLFVGGNFWNGRATGEKLGNPAADQAQGPVSQSGRTGAFRQRVCRIQGVHGIRRYIQAGLAGRLRHRMAGQRRRKSAPATAANWR